MWFWGIAKINLQNLKTFCLKVRSEKHVCKPKYGSIRSRALDSCCIPCVPLRIARAPLEYRAFENGVKEGCSYSYDLEIVAGLYEKREKLETHNWNNDLQVGCFITNSFPCAHGEIASRVKHLNILSGFQCFLLSMITSFIRGGDMEFPGVLKKEQVESPGFN